MARNFSGDQIAMNSRHRLLLAIHHQEPDRIPLDLGSTQVTGIHVQAYKKLRGALGLAPSSDPLCDAIQQLAAPDMDLISKTRCRCARVISTEQP